MSAKPLRTSVVRRREGEVIKPGEIVAVEGVESWTLAERRIWNQLLVNACRTISRTQRRCSRSRSMSCAAATKATTNSGPTCGNCKALSFRPPSERQDTHCPDAGRNRS